MDFYQISEKVDGRKKDVDELVIFPNWTIGRTNDLMVQGGAFYAIWDEENRIWSTDEYDVQRLVDKDLFDYAEKRRASFNGTIDVKLMRDFSSRSWIEFKKYVSNISDNSHPLDEKVIFANDKIKKRDYVSKRLPYALEDKKTPAYEELISTLYDPEEREKIEWCVGSILNGDSKKIQKFAVLYGKAGSGKSTILNVIQKLLEGYYTTFEAKALAGNNNQFATEMFKDNPLLAIQHDGDLSKIEDNTKLNSIVSHEEMLINEKYKSTYTQRFNCFLMMGTNQPVKITDAKSGLLRRLIDISPSGRKISTKRYNQIINQIDFELGGIANHCMHVYEKLGINYYNSYRPIQMMQNTDIFYNFVEENFHFFKNEDIVTLKQAYDMYKEYCDEALTPFKLTKTKFKFELQNYFENFDDRGTKDGERIRNYYSGFITDAFKQLKEEDDTEVLIELKEQPSLLDDVIKNNLAQYASKAGTPSKPWDVVKTKLNDIDTSKLHYVAMNDNHIVIDFDIKDKEGNKSLDLNLKAASKWPLTYSEVSKSGSGIHLHYVYEGDVNKLSRVYEEHIEIKVFTGKSSLRRQLTKCNNLGIAKISSGLPTKGEKMLNFDGVKSERKLRTLISRNLMKEIHPGTKPSIDFIHKILEDAYEQGLKYDVTDMRPKILNFALGSTNQAETCLATVEKMKFKSEDTSEAVEEYDDDIPLFYDVEVFPNLFVVVWKRKGGQCVKMINPSPKEIEELLKFKLIGFNCRRYDNHIMYARYIGYNNNQLYELSRKIIANSKNAMFGEAYNLSYTDVYDFASAGNKKSLKKFEIDLGLHHQELGLPWDQPVPEDKWPLVADYCCNDVIATEATFDHLSGDWAARQILAELSGLSVNDTTNRHSTRIIFGDNKKPQSEFVYTDLSELFPGYQYKLGKSTYRGVEVGEGGYVFSKPGIWTNVDLLDIASMHPTSIKMLNLFGDKFTKKFTDITEARLAVKHKNFEELDTLLDGTLVKYANEVGLADALKTVINSVYGLTSAKFDNPFRDPRNKDNIVAKRGALFMVELKHVLESRGVNLIHVKTDSVKVSNASPDDLEFIFEFGREYGYEFEHEASYEKMVLLNDSTYAAKDEYGWTSTGTQLIHPYVFKTLFSHDELSHKDLIEAKSVTTEMHLDMNESLKEGEHDYHFVGKAGAFYPIKPGAGGGELLRKKDDKYYAVGGTKGYRWLEVEFVDTMNRHDDIDINYYNDLVDKAMQAIGKFGDAELFISDEPYEVLEFEDSPPWLLPCGVDDIKYCDDCQYFMTDGETYYCEKCNPIEKMIIRRDKNEK